MRLEDIARSQKLLGVGRLAIEDALVEFRDGSISAMRVNNGLVIREKNGNPSSIIRFDPGIALRIGLLAIAEHLKKEQGGGLPHEGAKALPRAGRA